LPGGGKGRTKAALEVPRMTPVLMLAVGLSMFATAFLSGIFGMAGGMILIGILLAILPLPAAMALHAVTQMASNGWRALLWWRYVRLGRAAGYLIGCGLALTAWSLFRYVPHKAAAMLMLGAIPFLVRLLPARFKPDAERLDHGALYGVICMSLLLLTGVAGPLLDTFFLGGRLDRREMVATKAVCQVFGHAAKLFYFGELVAHAASLDGKMIAIAVVAAMSGTTAARRFLEGMTNAQYRFWANRIIVSVCGYYVLQGSYLLIAPLMWRVL
jgi:uncharacterized membrane protein YfcA